MIAVAVFGVWAFYGLGTYGWILVKGYNITFAEWFSPVKPYYWAKGTPPMVPAGSVFPTAGGKTAAAAKIQAV